MAATREDVRDTHMEAVAHATGRSRLQVYDDWLGHGDLEPAMD